MKKLLYFMGRSVCHQLPERSFFIQNNQFPLCARCTGIYIGMLLGLLYLLIRKRDKGNRPPAIKQLIVMVICWIPMMVDGVTSYVGVRDTNNLIRFITGLFFGVFIPVFIILLRNFDAKRNNNIPIIHNSRDMVYMIFILLFAIILLKINHIIIWWLIAPSSVMTILFIYIQVFYIIIKQLFSSIKKKYAYFFAFLFSSIIMSGLSIINKLLQLRFR